MHLRQPGLLGSAEALKTSISVIEDGVRRRDGRLRCRRRTGDELEHGGSGRDL